jgi:hypothetical protein
MHMTQIGCMPRAGKGGAPAHVIFVGQHALDRHARAATGRERFRDQRIVGRCDYVFPALREPFTFRRFLTRREINEFGSVSSDPVVRDGPPRNGTNKYDAAAVLGMAFRLATVVEQRSTTPDASRS